mgnify:CR=1 FL=1
MEAMRRYYVAQQNDLTRQILQIELFLGFVEQADNLAVRVAKLEKFVGLKG